MLSNGVDQLGARWVQSNGNTLMLAAMRITMKTYSKQNNTNRRHSYSGVCAKTYGVIASLLSRCGLDSAATSAGARPEKGSLCQTGV
jgi:hypothetical protein